MKAQCTWFRWKTTRSASGSLMKQGIRTVSLWRKQSNLIQPDWWETTSQNVLAHVDKNTISHIIRQSDDMVDNLFIMRFDLRLILPLCDETVLALIFIWSEI